MDEGKKQLKIKVNVGDRTYPMTIMADEEENIRAAAVNINKKVKEFENRFAGSDKQDYLAMAALMFAVDALRQGSKVSGIEQEFTTKLIELDNTLTEFLEKEN